MADNLRQLIKSACTSEREFEPYHELSEEADALTVFFKPDADFSKRLTDHVTLFLSLDNPGDIVGCRIKGITSILEDLPNYLRINHDEIELSVIFWSFRGGVDDDAVRAAFNAMAKAASEREMVLQPSI